MRPGSAAAAARAGRDLRRLHPPLPLRRSECQTRRGGAGARARGEAGAEGGGRGRGLGGSEPRTYWWARGRSRALFGPPPAPLALGARGLPEPAAATPAATGNAHWAPASGDLCGGGRAGESQREGRTNGQAPARLRRREPSCWRRACALPLLYTAPRRRGTPPTSGQASQSPARRGGARAGVGERGRAWGRHKEDAVARGVGRRAGARSGAAE